MIANRETVKSDEVVCYRIDRAAELFMYLKNALTLLCIGVRAYAFIEKPVIVQTHLISVFIIFPEICCVKKLDYDKILMTLRG